LLQAKAQVLQNEYFSKERLRVHAELATVPRKPMRELLQARRDAAKVEAETRIQEFHAGSGTITISLDAQRRLLQAEFEFAETKEDRVNARVAYLEAMMLMFNVNKSRYDDGKITIADLKQTEYYRTEAEIDLLREKSR
jgi:outer membrane protein TolC